MSVENSGFLSQKWRFRLTRGAEGEYSGVGTVVWRYWSKCKHLGSTLTKARTPFRNTGNLWVARRCPNAPSSSSLTKESPGLQKYRNLTYSTIQKPKRSRTARRLRPFELCVSRVFKEDLQHVGNVSREAPHCAAVMSAASRQVFNRTAAYCAS